MANDTTLASLYRSECPHASPCWCRDCKRAYNRVYIRRYANLPTYCSGCGGTKPKAAKYCSECARLFNRKSGYGTEGVCRFCKKTTHRKQNRLGAMYCDNACRYKHLKPLQEMEQRDCQWCWSQFEVKVKSIQRYCPGSRCGTLARSQLTVWHVLDRCHLPHCEDCGQVGGFNPYKSFICSSCSFKRATALRHAGHAKRQAAVSDGNRSIHWRPLGDRDNWVCHLCQRSVPKAVGSSKKRNGATVDHLVPLADGGAHQWENVALAHWSCNISRGARASERGVQLRLIG